MTKILIPTDFSVTAQNTIDYAVYLFEKEPCIFYILHAYVIAPSASETRSDAESHLENIVQKLKKNQGQSPHNFKWILIADIPTSAINATLINKDIDYLFLGTKGYSGFSEIFMGSPAVNIIKQLTYCPIIAVPSEIGYNPPYEIVFATDYKKSVNPLELAPLFVIAQLWKTTVDVVHVKTEKELTELQLLNKKELKESFEGTKHNFQEVIVKDSISTAILKLVEENKNIGMLAVLNTKHGFLEKLLREPIIRNVVFSSKVPLLLLPVVD